MTVKRLDTVYIKLGGACNLHCKYCHAEEGSFRFNPDILPVLKGYGVRKIIFGGGEPLLYWETIRRIVLFFGRDVQYKMVSNGTLFTDGIVDFCNEYRIAVSISMDGIGTTRDMSKPIQWECIRRLWCSMTAVTFYRETSDIRKSLESLNDVKREYLTAKPFIWSSFPNFVHSTEGTGVLSDRALAETYVSQMTALADEAFRNYVTVSQRRFFPAFLKRVFREFVERKNTEGVACCNSGKINILADGTVCVCPYTYEKVGDVFRLDDIDWGKVRETYSRKDCGDCPIFGVCRNKCCIDITDNQCYVMRKMNGNVLALMEKYGITYDECRGKSRRQGGNV